MENDCKLLVKYFPGMVSTNLSLLLLFVVCELLEKGCKKCLNMLQEMSKYSPCWTIHLWKKVFFFPWNKFSTVSQIQHKADLLEVAYINNSHLSKELIAWQELLNLLEVVPCRFSHPKNVLATDLHILRSNTFPIFATGLCPIECVGAYGLRDEQQTAVMDSIWRIFEFSHQIPNDDI